MSTKRKSDLNVDLRDVLQHDANPNAELSCVVRDPNGQNIDATIELTSDRGRDVKFCPKLTGKHNVYLYYDKDLVPGSPFIIEVLQKPTQAV
jgi:Filamin/ABP280 repeat.